MHTVKGNEVKRISLLHHLNETGFVKGHTYRFKESSAPFLLERRRRFTLYPNPADILVGQIDLRSSIYIVSGIIFLNNFAGSKESPISMSRIWLPVHVDPSLIFLVYRITVYYRRGIRTNYSKKLHILFIILGRMRI